MKLTGVANNAYELMYNDGTAWQTIVSSNTAASGNVLGWWNISRLNGQYTVVLRVKDGSGYSLSSQEISIGKLVKAGDSSPDNLRVASPYNRVELTFKPNSYSEDKLITITPLNLKSIANTKKPDIYSIGPIAEILPHSTFNVGAQPQITFKLTQEEVDNLKQSGVNIESLNL